MTDPLPFAWPAMAYSDCDTVPPCYHGVWMRSVLDTPDLRDTTTFVRWIQLQHWHADLRVPAAALADRDSVPLSQCSEQQLALLTTQQGFCGITKITTQVATEATAGATANRETCTWHRLVDYHPPGPLVDAGTMVFESPDCVIETGIHGIYLERWHRMPGSTGRAIALAQPKRADGWPGARLFIAGKYMMRVQPRDRHGPDFEISFGTIDAGIWHIEHSTLPQHEGQPHAFSVARSGTDTATVTLADCCSQWQLLEWDEGQDESQDQEQTGK